MVLGVLFRFGVCFGWVVLVWFGFLAKSELLEKPLCSGSAGEDPPRREGGPVVRTGEPGPDLQQETPADLEELKKLPNNELERQNKPSRPRVSALNTLRVPGTLRQPGLELRPVPSSQ